MGQFGFLGKIASKGSRRIMNSRKVLLYTDPDILPVGKDNWERLNREIDLVKMIVSTAGNFKWTIIGFCGSLVISLSFYMLSGNANSSAVAAAIALLIGLSISVIAFHKHERADMHSHSLMIEQCKSTLREIESHFEKADVPKIDEGDSSPTDDNSSTVIFDRIVSNQRATSTTLDEDNPKDILRKLTKNKIGR